MRPKTETAHSRCIQVAMLDYESYMHEQEANRRVYSVNGVAPTVTAGGGTHTTKILVAEDD